MAQQPFKRRSCFGAMEGGVPPRVQFLNAELTSKFYEKCLLGGKRKAVFLSPIISKIEVLVISIAWKELS